MVVHLSVMQNNWVAVIIFVIICLRLSVVLHVSAFICEEEIGWIWCHYFVTVSVVCSWLSSLYRRLTIIDAGKIVVTATAGIELHGIPHPP